MESPVKLARDFPNACAPECACNNPDRKEYVYTEELRRIQVEARRATVQYLISYFLNEERTQAMSPSTVANILTRFLS